MLPPVLPGFRRWGLAQSVYGIAASRTTSLCRRWHRGSATLGISCWTPSAKAVRRSWLRRGVGVDIWGLSGKRSTSGLLWGGYGDEHDRQAALRTHRQQKRKRFVGRSRNAASDIIRIDRFDQREVLRRRNQSVAWAPQCQPDLLDPFSHLTTCVSQLPDGSGIEGRVVDLVFSRMERSRLAEGVGEQVGLPVQILAVEPQQATEVCGSHHEDGTRLVTEFTVHLAGAVPAGIDAPVSQHPERTVVDTFSRRQGGFICVQMAIEVVSQHLPAAVGVADENGVSTSMTPTGHSDHPRRWTDRGSGSLSGLCP